MGKGKSNLWCEGSSGEQVYEVRGGEIDTKWAVESPSTVYAKMPCTNGQVQVLAYREKLAKTEAKPKKPLIPLF